MCPCARPAIGARLAHCLKTRPTSPARKTITVSPALHQRRHTLPICVRLGGIAKLARGPPRNRRYNAMPSMPCPQIARSECCASRTSIATPERATPCVLKADLVPWAAHRWQIANALWPAMTTLPSWVSSKSVISGSSVMITLSMPSSSSTPHSTSDSQVSNLPSRETTSSYWSFLSSKPILPPIYPSSSRPCSSPAHRFLRISQ